MERLRLVATALAHYGQRELAGEVAQTSLAIKRASGIAVLAWGEDEEEEEEEDSDLFSREDMESSAVIHDARHGGYDVSYDDRHMGHFVEFDDALKAINHKMTGSNYFPNIYHVNDHGNVDLLDSRGKILKSRV